MSRSTVNDPDKPRSDAHLAEMLGIDKGLVSRLKKKRGMPTHSLAAAEAWRAANLDPGRLKGVRPRADQSPTPKSQQERPRTHFEPAADSAQLPSEPSSFQEARTRREMAEAVMAEMEARKMAGTFLDRATMDALLFATGRQLRDGLLSCSRRLGAIVAPMTAPEACATAIEKELRALLHSWATSLGTEAP